MLNLIKHEADRFIFGIPNSWDIISKDFDFSSIFENPELSNVLEIPMKLDSFLPFATRVLSLYNYYYCYYHLHSLIRNLQY